VKRGLITLGMIMLLIRPSWSQDTLQVGYNYRSGHGWDPFAFSLNSGQNFAQSDSDYIVCRVSAEALGYQQGEVLCNVNIWAQWPDETWRDLSLGCYALDAVRFLDHVDEYGTPLGHYTLKADIDLPGGTRTVWSDLWIIDEAPQAIDDLMIQLDKDDIYLCWTEPYDDVGVAEYIIYRSIAMDSPGDSLASTVDTFYVDASAVGDTVAQYVYAVKAVDTAGGKSDESNKAGEFDITLINGEPMK